MDLNYLWACASFMVGALAGFQAIDERYGKGSATAAVTSWGVRYLALRGIIPTILYLVLYHYSVIENHLFFAAMGCGAGAEAFLRSSIYLKQTVRQDGGQDDLMWGPFKVLKWFQGYCLEKIAGGHAINRMKFVRSIVWEITFEEGIRRFKMNQGSWYAEVGVKSNLERDITKLETQYYKQVKTGSDPPEYVDKIFRFKLAYLILDRLGPDGLKAYLKNQNGNRA